MNFLSQFGTYGSDSGQLSYPSGIVIDDNNLVYVTESYSIYVAVTSIFNHCISIFTADGHFIRFFGHEGSAMDCFNGPVGMTIDNDGYLYVCDSCNNREVVYWLTSVLFTNYCYLLLKIKYQSQDCVVVTD